MSGREFGEEIILPTDGMCMRPLLWPGGRVHVRRCRVEELELGDIAVWFDGGRLLSHRVIALGRDGWFVTRGDLNRHSDPAAGPSQLLGRAVRFTIGPISYPLDSRALRAVARGAVALLPLLARLRAGLAGRR